MADIRFIRGIESLDIIGDSPAVAIELLREALDDIADHIEEKARELAPEGPTGDLKAHPVDRSDVIISQAETGVRSFGGGFTARGAKGRFVAGGLSSGQLVGRSVITVAEDPFYAIFVHGGTGLFGPKKRLITPRTQKFMRFHYVGKWWMLRTVRGQKAQPYLARAYRAINSTYVPVRLSILQREIDALT